MLLALRICNPPKIKELKITNKTSFLLNFYINPLIISSYVIGAIIIESKAVK